MKSWVKVLLLLIFVQPAWAGLDKDLTRAFNKMGAAMNTTQPNVYRGQEGAMAFAGNAYLRTEHRTLQPFSYQPPGWNASGCDFDVHLGGFDFVNGKKFVQMARAIGSSAGGYFFSLALKQIAPQIMNQMEALQNMANKFNQFNMESCDAAMYFVDQGVDLFRKAGNAACVNKAMMKSSNEYGSSATARDECGKPNVADALSNEASEDENLKDSIALNKNLAWFAIQKDPTLKAMDNDTKYFLMSLTGTIIISQAKVGAPQTPVSYPSKLENDKSTLLDALSAGSKKEITVYACKDDNEKCLALDTEAKIKFDISKTFYEQVRKMLKSIEKTVKEGTKLTDEQKNFIEKDDLRIYKLIKLQTAFTRNIPVSFINEYVDLIAMDLLYDYLDQCIGDVMEAFSGNLMAKELDKNFYDMMIKARDRLAKIQTNNSQRAAQRQALMFRITGMQAQLTANLSGELYSKMSWSKNLRSNM
jgi:conjugative transfer pilus assembly protein TraH